MITEAFKRTLNFFLAKKNDYDWQNFNEESMSFVAYIMPLGKKINEEEWGWIEKNKPSKDQTYYHLYAVLSIDIYKPTNRVKGIRPFAVLRNSGIVISPFIKEGDDLENWVSTSDIKNLSAFPILQNFEPTKNKIHIPGMILNAFIKQIETFIQKYNLYYLIVSVIFADDISTKKILENIGGHKESNSDEVKKLKEAIKEDRYTKSTLNDIDKRIFFRVKGKEYETFFKGREGYENIF
jgi:hypothetical protein